MCESLKTKQDSPRHVKAEMLVASDTRILGMNRMKRVGVAAKVLDELWDLHWTTTLYPGDRVKECLRAMGLQDAWERDIQNSINDTKTAKAAGRFWLSVVISVLSALVALCGLVVAIFALNK